MNDTYIEIKEKRPGFIAKGLLWLFLTLLSLFCALLPYVLTTLQSNKFLFFIIGGIFFVAFAIIFVLHVFNECKPKNALVLTDSGFIHVKTTDSVEVLWTNVASVKMCGRKDSPFLGITLENNDLLTEKLKPKFADIIKCNLEENLPAILISQNDIRVPLSELKETCTKFVRDARNFDAQEPIPSKQKNNPFSTEDVLRAFGKLPQTPQAPQPSPDIITPPISTVNLPNNDIEFDLGDEPHDSKPITENSAFYNALSELAQPSKISNVENPTDAVPQMSETPLFIVTPAIPDKNDSNDINEEKIDEPIPLTSTDDDMPDEIRDILNRAKSTKINELEKILNEKELPYSFSRTENAIDLEAKSDKPNDIPIGNQTPIIKAEQKSENSANSESVELKLESMINNVLNEDPQPSRDELSIDGVFSKKSKIDNTTSNDSYPKLVLIDDNETNSKKKSYDDFVIPKLDD